LRAHTYDLSCVVDNQLPCLGIKPQVNPQFSQAFFHAAE
jgi:hypothetical protein